MNIIYYKMSRHISVLMHVVWVSVKKVLGQCNLKSLPACSFVQWRWTVAPYSVVKTEWRSADTIQCPKIHSQKRQILPDYMMVTTKIV
jgi:hypothetical protein